MKTVLGAGAFVATLALAGCATDAPTIDSTPVVQAQPVAAIAAPSGPTADISAAAQVIAANFNSISGQNMGGGWQFDGATAVGNRVTVTIEVPVSGRNYRNFDRPGDRLRADLRRGNCASDTISAFLLLGGVLEVEIQGRDNVLIGTYVFDEPC